MAPTPQQLHQLHKKKLSRTTKQKQPNARVQRYLKKQESQLIEPARQILLLKGIRCSDAMTTILRDFRSMNAPHSKLLLKNNAIVAFDGHNYETAGGDDEGINSLEFLTTKNDCSLFAMASHNKKRPNNLILGRTFNRTLLDMAELGISYYKSIADYKLALKKRIGSKPMLYFAGDLWEHQSDFMKLRNLLMDVYRGDPVSKLILSGVDHLIAFTVSELPSLTAANPNIQQSNPNARAVVHMRTFFVKLKKNPTGDSDSAPVPFLVPCGPDMDYQLRRTQFASPDIWKQAMKQPKQNKSKKVKNHKTNIFGETIGRLHLEKQDIDKMGGKKSKALRVAHKVEKAEESEKLEVELKSEKNQMEGEFKQTYGFDETDMEK